VLTQLTLLLLLILSSVSLRNLKLKWQKWSAADPTPLRAVSIYNKYMERLELVCRTRCNAGFFTPSKGPLCYFPNENKVYFTGNFEILVNEDDFEILEWKDGYSGSLPQNSVRTCAGVEIYVGKNKYGLGKVVPEEQSFFLLWERSEYWYRSYKVLTTDNDVESNLVTDVRYNTDGATVVSYPPETMHVSVVTNYECNPVSKSTTLTKTVREEKRWDLGSSITLGVKTEFKVGLPSIVSGGIEISAETSFQASGGNSVTEEVSHSVSLNLFVPPNQSCTVRMVGYKYRTDIPFTARFKRTYSSGKVAWTSISGTYDSVQVGEVHTVVDQCKPVGNASPCPQRAS
uniref:Aerolysin-like C-terminal domain-containing protein n=1 Tax=Stegastes partitus TaxID=144197 RepID=A0A3B4ZSD7_9TELE